MNSSQIYPKRRW